MPSRQTHFAAVLAAALLFAPTATRVAWAADEPAEATKPADAARPGDAAPPAEGRGRAQVGALVERVENALKDLKLSDEQKAKTKALLAKTKEAMGAAGQSGRERLQAASKAIADLREGLANVLSDDQKKALAEKLPFLGRGAGAGGAAGGPGAAGGGVQRPAAMQRIVQAAIEKLDVPADQKAKLKAVTEETQKKIREVVESGKVEREAMAEKIKPLLDAQREKIAEILSSDQLPKFQQAVREQVEKLRGEAGGAGGRPGARDGDKKADEKPADEKKDEKKTEEK